MKYTIAVTLCLAALGMGIFGRPVAADQPVAPPSSPVVGLDWQPFATSKIKDLTATLRVNDDQTDFDELKKIGGAFATSYRVSKTVNVTYEYPNKGALRRQGAWRADQPRL